MVKGGSMAASSPTGHSPLSYSNSSAGSTESFSSDTSFGDNESVTDSISDHPEFADTESSSSGEVRHSAGQACTGYTYAVPMRTD